MSFKIFVTRDFDQMSRVGAGIVEATKQVETELAGEGRVLIRYSGTQNMCRVMVEGPTKEITEKYAEQLAEVVKKAIG